MATKEELALQEKEIELEERKLNIEAIKLNNAKLRREADKERMDALNLETQRASRGVSLKTQRPEERNKEVRRTCTHKMGGKGREGLLSGRGNFEQYAVSKVRLATGDVMIRCNRCRTTWLPPIQSDYVNKAGQLDTVNFEKAVDAYNEAFNFPCDLAMGGMPRRNWFRGGKSINHEISRRYAAGQFVYEPPKK